MTINKSDGTSCSSGNGRCYSGTCCTGCWNGSSCQPGAFDTGCGYGGVLCTVCASFQCCDVRFMPFQCSSDPMAGGPDCPP